MAFKAPVNCGSDRVSLRGSGSSRRSSAEGRVPPDACQRVPPGRETRRSAPITDAFTGASARGEPRPARSSGGDREGDRERETERDTERDTEPALRHLRAAAAAGKTSASFRRRRVFESSGGPADPRRSGSGGGLTPGSRGGSLRRGGGGGGGEKSAGPSGSLGPPPAPCPSR